MSISPPDAHADILAYHGGNLDSAMRAFPHAPRPWIDLSTGINAAPYPVCDVPLALWQRLPLSSDLARLEQAAAQAFGASAETIAAPGTQALIQLLPQLFRPRSVAILGHTYGEYARVWQQAIAENPAVKLHSVASLAELANHDLAILVNPNNPDGRLLEQSALHDLAHKMKQRGGSLILDEAFMDFTPQFSLASTQPDNVLILRSFGKTYGLAGLRLGFALAHEPLAARIRARLGPWAVSGPALELATRAYRDKAWREAEAQRLAAARQILEQALQQAGFRLRGGTHLFVLAQHDQGGAWFRHLAGQGILTRPFATHPDLIRFGIPTLADWPRLNAALAQRPSPASA